MEVKSFKLPNRKDKHRHKQCHTQIRKHRHTHYISQIKNIMYLMLQMPCCKTLSKCNVNKLFKDDQYFNGVTVCVAYKHQHLSKMYLHTMVLDDWLEVLFVSFNDHFAI